MPLMRHQAVQLMNRLRFILSACAFLAGCKATPATQTIPAPPVNDMGASFRANQFAQEYAAHKTTGRAKGETLRPKTVRNGIPTEFSFMNRPGICLKLFLGKRYSVKPGNITGPKRTTSKYKLLTKDGRLLAEAESIYAEDDSIEDASIRTRVFYDPVDGGLLIEEEWFGVTHRCILMTPVSGSPNINEEPSKWQARYLCIPGWEEDMQDRMQGIERSKLYIDYNGIYEFPFEDLLTCSLLEYTIG